MIVKAQNHNLTGGGRERSQQDPPAAGVPSSAKGVQRPHPIGADLDERTADWIFESVRGGTQKRTPLHLYWELLEALAVDNVTADYREEVPIFWSVTSNTKPEFAPFSRVDHPYGNENFLAALLHLVGPPRSAAGLVALPVVDQRWTTKRADKGGLIQEATGFRPSPFPAEPVRFDVLRNNPPVEYRRS